MFINRTQAGRMLAEQLKDYKGTNALVLAIPRGGLPLGAVIAKTLDIPLGVALSKKIGHPGNKEYAIGAVSLNSVVLDRQAEGISKSYIESEVEKIRTILRERQQMYYRNRSPESLRDKTVIIVDDGIATGNTMLSTVELVHKELPEKIILAIPVAPESAIQKLARSPFIDDIVCLEIPAVFHAVGAFYQDFEQVSDREAIALLEEDHSGTINRPGI